MALMKEFMLRFNEKQKHDIGFPSFKLPASTKTLL